MKKTKEDKMKQLISVGIDVSKGKSTVCIMSHPKKIIHDSFTVLHTISDLALLEAELQKLSGEIKIIMESTGHYHLPIAVFFRNKGYQVFVENAYVVKQFSRIMLHGVKTDPIDARKLARYGLAYWEELTAFVPRSRSYEQLNFLSKQYHTYIKLLIVAKQNVIYLMDQTLPGFKKALDSGGTAQFSKIKYVDFARAFFHIDVIKTMGHDKFKEEYEKWCKEKGYRFQENKVDELYQLAEDGIPTLPSEHSSTSLCMELATEQVTQTGLVLEQILTQMQALAKSLPEYNIVRQMNGIGDRLCARIIADIGDVRRFYNGKALVAYAGIDAPAYQSGQFTGTRRKISKRGNSLLRKTGYEIMKCLKSHPPKTDTKIYDFIIKKELEGKSKTQAKIAGLNKFLHIYYARVMEIYESK